MSYKDQALTLDGLLHSVIGDQEFVDLGANAPFSIIDKPMLGKCKVSGEEFYPGDIALFCFVVGGVTEDEHNNLPEVNLEMVSVKLHKLREHPEWRYRYQRMLSFDGTPMPVGAVPSGPNGIVTILKDKAEARLLGVDWVEEPS